ncbi:MAG: ABC-type transport system involved in multi-copper enzyme maturation permease subunit [Candidatus Omnitrophota bacterium]|jgi:ABC-type transport system involved in multi-copper enzyme maturation permease subunit
MNIRAIWLIAKSVLIEAVRRREIYIVIFIALTLIGLIMTIDFFHLEGLSKFYREMALKIMSAATALSVIVLSARQLPREFEKRTIYPLLARPISRVSFLVGKMLGVLLAALFCFALFMIIFIAGNLYLGAGIPWIMFLQYVYLQMIMLLVLTTLCFWLSMVFNLDAAITVGVLLFILGATMMSMSITLFPLITDFGRVVLKGFTYLVPQVSLFDLSEKTVHAERWDPLGAKTLLKLTLYGGIFSSLYFSFALLCFRRRPL